jgi:hypothetical protein
LKDIVTIKDYSTERELFNKLRKVSLRGQPDKLPYENAYMSIEVLYPVSLSLAQNYVLKPELDKITDLYYHIKRHRVNILNLAGHVVIEYADGEEVGIIPPIVEEAIIDRKIFHLIADGQHRCYLSYLRHEPVSVVLIRGAAYPYYAFPKQNQDWSSVEIRDDLPETYMKKAYVQDNHKELFRDFVPQFNNLSVGRGNFVNG